MKTLVIDNFHGSMTPYADGDLNSGLANVISAFGYNPFFRPGNLTWYEEPELIDSAGSVITDFILAGQVRAESGIIYVYAIGHTGRLYKIQVNDPTTYNPNYDNPVLLATLTVDSPTFTRGGFIEFYGATEKIYIGHDKGVNSINFDGTGEAAVGVSATWAQNVPRPFIQFLGNLYVGNGPNIAEINTTATVATYAKLSPAFPAGTQVRDLDVTPDGTYLEAVVTELALSDITSTAADTSIISPSNSYIFKWNGTDTGYTSYVTYPNTALSANQIFGENQYTFGYDSRGGGVYNPRRKFLTSSPESSFGESPLPNAVSTDINMLTWATTLPFEGHLEGLYSVFGTISDFEIQPGYWSPLSIIATSPETDVNRIGCQIPVSNYAQGSSSNNYTNQVFGVPKIYISSLESSAAPTTKYRLYKWSASPTGLGNAVSGYYQTQNQIFTEKITVKAIRIYADPWVANNSFKIYLIGAGDVTIPNGEITLTAQNSNAQAPMYIGSDYAWWNPEVQPTYSLAIGIENLGTANFIISKIEIDVDMGGK